MRQKLICTTPTTTNPLKSVKLTQVAINPQLMQPWTACFGASRRDWLCQLVTLKTN